MLITPHIETTTHLVQSLAATQLKYFVLFSCIFFFFSLDKLRAQLVLPFFLVLFGGVSSPRPNFKKTAVPCCRHCPHVRFERQLSTNAVFIWFLFSSSAGKLSIMASGNEEVSPNTTGTTRPREYTEDDDEQILKKQRRLLRNRQAAAQSRARKKEYIKGLEKKVITLSEEVQKAQLYNKEVSQENWKLKVQINELHAKINQLTRENLELKYGVPSSQPAEVAPAPAHEQPSPTEASSAVA